MPTQYDDKQFTVLAKEVLEMQHKLNDFMTLGQQYNVPAIMLVGMLDFTKQIVLSNLMDEYKEANNLQKVKEEMLRQFDSVPKSVN